MIKRDDSPREPGLWGELAAPVPASEVQWRINGRPKARDGKFFAPFVAYIDAQFVRDRLDSVVPGEWDLTLELLPALTANGDGEALDEPCAFKARLQVLGVIREDVGSGRDYKTATTDAFKRAAMRFGVGHELYTDYDILWVQVDGDGKYARPVEEPSEVYARKHRANGTNGSGVKSAAEATSAQSASSASTGVQASSVQSSAARQQPAPETPGASPASTPQLDEPSCPKCGGRVWDNRLSKRNPKAPDYKCRSRSCDGVIWPPKNESTSAPMVSDDGPPLDDSDFNEALGF